MDLTWPQVLAWRLGRQFVTSPGPDAVAVAERLCGGAGAGRVVGRAGGLPPARPRAPGRRSRQALWTDRTLLKTWSIRGTLHLLPTASWPVYRAVLGTLRYWDKPSWHRGSGVSAEELDAIIGAVPEALGDAELTREELVDAVIAVTGDEHLRPLTGLRLGAALQAAELPRRALPRRARAGKVTFTAPPRVGEMSPEEGGVALLRAFLGPTARRGMAAFDGWLFRGLTRRAVLRQWFADLAPATVTVEGRNSSSCPNTSTSWGRPGRPRRRSCWPGSTNTSWAPP